ncbi:MAG: hypothetical protein AAF962_17250 [Actinomycetota bacterium]
MTESSYTAWDGNLYEWPPPDGWYEAADGKWWPEGYGPSDDEDAEGPGNGASAGAPVAGGTPTAGNGAVPSTDVSSAQDDDDDDDGDDLPDISDLFGGEDIFADDGDGDGDASDEASPAPAATTEVAAEAPDVPAAVEVDPTPDADPAPDLGVVQAPAAEEHLVEEHLVEESLAEVTPIGGAQIETPVVETPEPVEVGSGFGVTPAYDDGPEAFADEPEPERELDRDPAPDPAGFGGGMLLTDQGGYVGAGSPSGGGADPYGRAATGYAPDGYDDGDGYGETMVDDGYGGRGQLLDDRDEAADDRDDDYRQPSAYQETDDSRTNWPLAVAGACLAALIALLLIYLLTRGGGDDIETAPPPAAVTGPGSISEPYALGTDVAVYYDDDQGVQSRWVVKVLSPVVDGTGTLAEAGDGQLPEGEALAVTRVRLTYESGPNPGSVSDLLFNAVGDSATVYDPTIDACGTVAEAVALDTQLEPGQFFEGNLCWQVASVDLASLKLAMEAVPAEGRIHLVLN